MGDPSEKSKEKKKKRKRQSEGRSADPVTLNQEMGDPSEKPKEKKKKRKRQSEGTSADPVTLNQEMGDPSEKPKEKKKKRKRQSEGTSVDPVILNQEMRERSENQKEKKKKRKRQLEDTTAIPVNLNQGVVDSSGTPKEKGKKSKELPEGTHTDPETFDQGDVIDSFNVKYNVGPRIDHRTFHASILRKDGGKWYDVTIQLYKKKAEALYIYSLTKSPPTGSSITRAMWLDIPDGGYPTIIFEKFYPLTFEDWLTKLRGLRERAGRPGIWKCKKDGTILSLGPEVRTTFMDIVAALRILHYDEKYHGQLRNGIRISGGHRAQLVNFRQQGCSKEGTIQDLHDLRQLVERVCALDVGQNEKNKWIGLQLFEELENVFNKQPEGLPGSLKKYAFFTYISPFFHDETDRHQLFIKFLEFRKINAEDFSKMVSLSKGLTEIADWQAAASNHEHYANVFHHKNTTEGKATASSVHYISKAYIVKFYKNCLKHAGENTECEILEQLHHTYPDVIHKLFLNFVETIGVHGTFEKHEVIPLFRKGEAAFY